MDNLEQTAKIHLNHNVAKRNLAEKAEESLTLAYEGGLFKVTPELISFVSTYTELPNFEILKDIYDTPIKITDIVDFQHKIIQKYNEVMNGWHQEYEELSRIRKPEKL